MHGGTIMMQRTQSEVSLLPLMYVALSARSSQRLAGSCKAVRKAAGKQLKGAGGCVCYYL